MIKKYFFIFFCYPLFSLDLDKINGISAVIGNEIILTSEVKNYLDFSNEKMSLCKGLENLMSQKLILFHAKKDPDIQISEEELTANIFFRNQNNHSEKDFYVKLIEEIKNKQYIEKFNQKILKNIEVSPEEVRSFFYKNKKKFSNVPKQVYISYMIFYPKLSNCHRKKILDRLRKIKNEIHSDIDFSLKAILFSEEIHSALKGGLIQGIKKENLSKEFERTIFSLNEKEISEPFETNFGFHLVKVEKKIGDKIDIRHIFIKPKYTEKEFSRTKSFINSIKKRIINQEMVPNTKTKTISNEKNAVVNNSFIWKKQWIEENNLQEKMKKALSHLKNGEISDPYKEVLNNKQEVFFLVKLLKSIPSHKISLEEDYTRLKNLLKNIKKEHEIKNWVKAQLKRTYFRIEEKSCT
ncbi:peptidylprolyl isomerase [Blattabacterium cuenoti]|uniref:peptidylprolyl isomerase n=1 Tax=Blattabacterium cuenoti TaxID=1653831 RepID=UPI00163CF6AD|nr:peptidylprolyl isomerase [Blattabacterium cuenoti]